MDNFVDFFEGQNTEDCLAIPEPRPGGDIRPNPSPLKINDTATLELTALDIVAVKAQTLPPPQEDDVIRSADFHAYPNEDAPILERRKFDAVGFTPEHEDNTHSYDAKCYALMGASGGAGVTSLCIQLAFDIAKRTKKPSSFGQHMDPTVCLIDLDFETGSCASYMDIQPSLAISDICGPASRIDNSSIQALISQHESGIAVLATPNALGANSLANPEAVLALLDTASQLYEHVILDVPRIWQSWIAAAISGADHFALVCELNIASLHTTRMRIENIEKVLGEEINCEVILNKVERRSFRNSIRLSDTEKALQRSVSATICVDVDTTREAINCGAAVEVIRPEARYVKDAAKLSHLWLPDQAKKLSFVQDRRRKKAAA